LGKRKMDNRNEKGRSLLCTILTALIVCSVGTVGMGVTLASDSFSATRALAPGTVDPGGDVTVTIEFTTTTDFVYLFLRDHTPLGWDATDIQVLDGANTLIIADLFTHETTRKVCYLWAPLDSGVYVKVSYKLHVPSMPIRGRIP